MKFTLSIFLFFFISGQTAKATISCQSTEQFFKYIEVVRGINGIKQIKIKKGLFELSPIKAYSLPSPFARYDEETLAEIERLLPPDLRQIFREATANARNLDRNQTAKIISIALNVVQHQLSKMAHIFSTLADLNDTSFFYRRVLIKALVDQGEGLLQDSLPQGIGNTIGFYVFNEVINWILERQQFYQNIVLDNLDNAELGFSQIEKQKILSSIYESRIKWYQVFKKRKAQNHWLEFGTENFLQQKQRADKNLSKYFTPIQIEQRLDYGFATIATNEQRKIMHLLVPVAAYIDVPALAYDYQHPKKLLAFRVTLEAVRFGLQFVPPAASIPASLLSDYLLSLYVPQKRAEGAIVGATWRTCDPALMGDIVRQSINPILIRDFGVDWY